ncbi:sn-glycerol-3-phosphate ABC transporter ATP-binding protein UgpC [Labrenzia sp. DG1229]|uniref:ABC transporter ATP-binding protein n=1 Tax=Labrenzia sp. DG1229 TaxID=681847 RepID=UPI00048E8BA2|nr:sn-glycerol-3-phosphate ABC transporter ATP-binding protein UgpC [Labrenzia sp. DG1229]
MAEVAYHNICKSYGSVEVMRDLSLSIQDGEFAVLLGASGCGKTTLLRMTAGLENITGGELTIDGKVMNEVHPRDRDIAMVFQNYALYPTMKVFDNIAFSLEVKRLSKEEIKRKVNEAAAVLNLTDYLDRYPRELSGGQRQRVAMGRAMVRDAKVFLFDEPLSNLDAKLRAHMRVEIRQLHERLKATTVYVTHDQIEAMTMADKIVLMKGGRIEQVGTPDDLYDRPATRFAADFIGSPSMNFVEGDITTEDGNPHFVGPHINLPLDTGLKAEQGQKVICGLRPSDLVTTKSGEIKGTVKLVEKTGADVNIHVDLSETANLVATMARDNGAVAGGSIELTIPPRAVHLFDAETENRIETQTTG